MNQNRYRIVFNKARGQLMAVAENATSNGKCAIGEYGSNSITSDQDESKNVMKVCCTKLSPISRVVLLFTTILMLGSPIASYAQVASQVTTRIVADPNAAHSQQATILNTASGQVQVNIQTPTAAGVSMNQYIQFDVGSASNGGSGGAILNNSRTNTTTQTAGWVTGNPWLAKGPAKVIVNQVNSNAPSQVNGYVEVAGQRADVVIANPSGISVDGGGFINASRVSLVTGTPNLNSNGALTNYSVNGGQIYVSGKGLDTRGVDYTDLIARSVALNAGVWAKNLKVTTGNNQVDVSNTQVTKIAGTSAAPIFAIDSTALGGMYANAITFVGTENGVGVRNAGQVGAGQSGLSLSVDGQLTNSGKIISSADANINTSKDISNSGTIYAGGNTNLTTQGNIANQVDDQGNKGHISAGANTTLAANGINSLISNEKGALIGAGINSNGTLNPIGDLTLNAPQGYTGAGQLVAGGTMAVVGSTLNVADGNLNAGTLNLTATHGNLDASNAQLVGRNQLNVSTPQTLISDGAYIGSAQLNLNAHDISNVSGQLQQIGANPLNIHLLGNLNNDQGEIAAIGNINLTARELNSTAGKIQSDKNVKLNTSTLNNTQGIVSAQGTLEAKVVSSIKNTSGNLKSNGNIVVQTNTLENDDGAIASISGAINLNASAFRSVSGTLQANHDANITVQSLDNSLGKIHANNLTISSQGDINNSKGAIYAKGLLNIQSPGVLNNTSGTLEGINDVAVHVSTVKNSGGTLASVSGALSLKSGAVRNVSGTIQAAQDMNLVVSSLDNTLGRVQANNLLLSTVNDVNNTQGIVEAISSLNAQVSGSLINTSGTLQGNSNVHIQAETLKNKNGILASIRGTLDLNTGAADNIGGTLQAEQDLTLNVQSLDNTTGKIQGNSVTLASQGDVDNSQGKILAGSNLTLQTSGTLNNTQGKIAAEQGTQVTAKTLNNTSGTLASVSSSLAVNVSQQIINVDGKLQASRDIALNAAGIDNTHGLLNGDNLSVNTQVGSLSNVSGTISASSALSLMVGTLDNRNGKIQSPSQTTLNVSSLDNAQGTVHAGSALNGKIAGLLDNTSGTLGSEQDISLQIGQALINRNGILASVSGNVSLSVSHESINNISSTILSELLGTVEIKRSSILVVEDVKYSNQAVDNRGGQILAGDSIQLNTLDLYDGTNLSVINNQKGLIKSKNDLNISGATIDNSQTQNQTSSLGLSANQITLSAQTLRNVSGTLLSGEFGDLKVANQIDNTLGKITSKGVLNIQDTAISNNPSATRSLAINNAAGTLLAEKNLNIVAASSTHNGKINSQGDLTLDLTQGFSNVSEVAAKHNANVKIADNLYNFGNIKAGNTLKVSALNIYNELGGEFNATNTNLTAEQTLTNRGLIDGNNTFISAQTLENYGTGKIYGDNLGIQANTLTNTINPYLKSQVAPIIAARNRLDLGVETLNNSENAIIYSAGDIKIGGSLDANHQATGTAATINNAGATIQAQGNAQIDANVLNNTNPHFTTTKISSAPKAIADSIIVDGVTYEPGSVYLVDPIYWGGPADPLQYDGDGGHTRLIIPSATYPFKEWPIVPTVGIADRFYIVEGEVKVKAIDKDGNVIKDSEGEKVMVSSYNYQEPNNPIWEKFGVPQPTGSEPILPVKPIHPYLCESGVDCLTLAQYDKALVDYKKALTQYNTDIKLWEATYAKLDSAIYAYNTSLYSRERKAYTLRKNVSSIDVQDVTDSSTPAKILVGGDLILNSTKPINDKSQIVVGGDLLGTGKNVENIGAEGAIVTTTTGNETYSFIEDGGIFKSDARRYSHTRYTPAPVKKTIYLEVGTTLHNTANQPASQNIDAKGKGPTIASAEALRDVLVGSLTGPTTINSDAPKVNLDPVSTIAANKVSIIAPNNYRIPPLNLTLPNNALYQILYQGGANNPNAPLIQTDPRFTQNKQWLGSDYMASALALDPAKTARRLGDGFYEQQLINQQIIAATGYRRLEGYANDQDEFKALMDSGISVAKALHITPGVELTHAQIAVLTTDIVWLVEKTVTLRDGTTQKILAPQVYVRVLPGDLKNDGTLISADKVQMKLDGDLNNTGIIAGRKIVNMSAQNIENGGLVQSSNVNLSAKNDLNNLGGKIVASQSAALTAINNLTISSTTQSSTRGENNATTNVDRLAGVYVGGQGNRSTKLSLTAGNTLTIDGAQVTSSGDVRAKAKDINLGTVTTRQKTDTTWDDKNYLREDITVQAGTQLSGNNINLKASNDINARGADIVATHNATLDAGRDVNLDVAKNSSRTQSSDYKESSGFLSSSSELSQFDRQATHVQGSNLSGGTVNVKSGRDTNIIGSSVVADKDVNINAKNNINVLAATDTSNVTSHSESVSTGFSSGGGIGISYGTTTTTVDQYQKGTKQGQTNQRAAIGSLGGNVNLTAGKDITVTGSDLIAKVDSAIGKGGNLNLTGQNVTVNPGEDNTQTDTHTKTVTDSIGIQLTGSVATAVNTVMQMGEAASKTKNSRMQALAAATQAMALAQAASELASDGGSIGVSVTASHSESKTDTTDTSKVNSGSNLMANNINIKATGNPNDPSDKSTGNINIIGSDVSATNNINLNAKNKLNVLAAQDKETHDQESSNWSVGAGVGVSAGSGGTAAGFTASVGLGSGQERGQGTTQQNSHIKAGNTLTTQSGGDTNVQGAVLSGNTVEMDVGGDLNVASLQDTAEYQSKSYQANVSATVGYGASVSASLNYNKAKNSYASVYEQSGIQAGDGGFNIKVKGNTDLKGATITSTDQAVQDGKNSLDTKTLTQSEIQNHSTANAMGASLSYTYDSKAKPENSGKYGAAKQVAENIAGLASASGDAKSTTYSGISGAKLTIDGKTVDTAKGEDVVDSAGKIIRKIDGNTLTNQQVFKQDLNDLQAQVTIQQGFQKQVVKVAEKFTDEAFRKMFVAEAKMYQVSKGEDGKTIIRELSEAEKQNLKKGADGKLHVSNNGIFNDLNEAANNALQNTEGSDAPQYLIHFAAADNTLSELLIAGYQKFMEGNTLGLTNATQENVKLMNQYGQSGLELDGHSRGGMTIGNAMESIEQQSTTQNAPLHNTDINLYGSAYNAQDAANKLNTLSGGNGQVQQATHKYDVVGRIVGGNPGTGGTIPEGSSVAKEFVNTFGGSSTVHNNYGAGKSKEDAGKYWGGGSSTPVLVPPNNLTPYKGVVAP